MENITDEELLSVQTYSEVCRRLGIRESTIEEFRVYRGHAKKFFAFFKLKVVEKFFNGTWEPNWDDTSQLKWYPYFYKDSSSGWVDGDFAFDVYHDFHGLVAYFKTEQIAVHVGKAFKDIYLDLIL